MHIEISKEVIKDIADKLDCGFVCYYHIKNKNVVDIPEFAFDDPEQEEFWGNDINEIETNYDKYVEIAPPSSDKSFIFMEQFIETIDDLTLRNRFENAINKSRPFENFKCLINDSGDYTRKWFDFKNEKLMEIVESEIEAYNFKIKN